MKISKESIKMYFLFFVALMPELFTQIKPLFYLFSIFAILEFIYFTFRMIKRKIIYNCLKYWFLMWAYLLFVMIINNDLHDIDNWGKMLVFGADVALLLNYYVENNKTEQLFRVLSTLGISFLGINLILAIIIPNGLIHTIGGSYYFLGTRNSILKYFLAFISVGGLEYIYYKQKRRFCLIILLGIAQILLFNVSTAITCSLFILLGLLLRKIISKILKMKTILVAFILLNVGFIFFDVANFFSWFIINILHKDVGLNSRTLIWKKAIEIIFSDKVRLILGHGIQNNGCFVWIYNTYWPAHNQMLEWLYEFGIIGCAIIILFFLRLDNRKTYSDRKDAFWVYLVIAATFVGSISSGPLGGAPGYLALFLLPILNQIYNNNAKESLCAKSD